MTLIASTPGYPTNAEVQNQSPAASETPMRIAGAQTYLHQYINGALQPGAIKIAPSTPHNGALPGHDHSGGIMGAPQKHTVWSASFGYIGTGATGARAPSQNVTTTLTPRYIPSWGFSTIRGVWVPGGKAYALLTPSFQVYIETTACTVEFAVRGTNGVVTESTTYVSTGLKNYTFTEKVPLRRGRLNTYGFQLKITYTSGASTVWLLSAGLHQESTSV